MSDDINQDDWFRNRPTPAERMKGMQDEQELMRKVQAARESIIDPMKPTLDNRLFDGTTLKEDVAHLLVGRLWLVLRACGFHHPERFVENIYVIGSSMTYQWTDTSDLDVTVEVDDSIASIDKLRESVRRLNGHVYPGTEHPINFFFFALSEAKDLSLEDRSDAVYNLYENRWEKHPPVLPADFDPEHVFAKEQAQAKEIKDRVDASLKTIRDRMKHAHRYEIANMKLGEHDYDIHSFEHEAFLLIRELDDEIHKLAHENDKVQKYRRSAYAHDFDPSGYSSFRFSRAWASPNAVYKYLERWKVLDILHKMKEIDDSIREQEKKELV